MASAAQIAAAQKLADEMAAAAEAEDSDDAPLESLVTVRHNGAADRGDASDDEVMPTPKRRGPPTDSDAALAAALDADLAARKPLPDFRSDGPRVGETIRRKVERPPRSTAPDARAQPPRHDAAAGEGLREPRAADGRRESYWF